MAYPSPDSVSWALQDLLDTQSYTEFNSYGAQSETGLVHPAETPISFEDQLISTRRMMYPLDNATFNFSYSEAVPTEAFQSVPSADYDPLPSFDHPLFPSTEQLTSSVGTFSASFFYPSNQVESAALAPVDPLFPGSTELTSTTYHIPSPIIPIPHTPVEALTPQSRKRRQLSESSQSDDTLSRVRRTRIVKSPKATAKVRVIGACLYCKRRRTSCKEGHDAGGPCMPCLKLAEKGSMKSHIQRPLCWRPPKIKNAELFRRGPTIDFAASLRGHKADAKPGKQAVWDLFATGTKGRHAPKVVHLSQHWTSDTLTIELHRYQPMETDKQFYTWFDENGIERRYVTPPYGISDWRKVHSSVERFMERNFQGYIDAHLTNANEITRLTFEVAVEHRHLHLVDRALKIWVGCRFIEEPWSITSNGTSETLSLSPDSNPNSPYHARIPVPPIVDLQIDLIVINTILQPLLKETLTMVDELLKASNDGDWRDWFEVYLAYFVLLRNVEMAVAHDAWFVRRHGLKTKYSNKALIDTILQGATTLLQCFHHAHRGYAPLTNPDFENMGRWNEKEKAYLRAARGVFGASARKGFGIGGDDDEDMGREGFWTGQLGMRGWSAVSVC